MPAPTMYDAGTTMCSCSQQRRQTGMQRRTTPGFALLRSVSGCAPASGPAGPTTGSLISWTKRVRLKQVWKL
eukprot:1150773-Pelagomonas_calceolata.AAC.5